VSVLRWLDLAVLAAALPTFIALGAPLLGYVVAGGAWLVGRAAHLAAQARATAALSEGNRRGAVGLMGAVTLGRVWLVALSVLIVGLAEREAGLAAAVLAAALFTSYLAGLGLTRLLEPSEGGP
jgi:putative exporter of polyketide antibiotics